MVDYNLTDKTIDWFLDYHGGDPRRAIAYLCGYLQNVEEFKKSIKKIVADEEYETLIEHVERKIKEAQDG